MLKFERRENKKHIRLESVGTNGETTSKVSWRIEETAKEEEEEHLRKET